MVIFRCTGGDGKKRIAVFLSILDDPFQGVYRFVIVSEIVHQDNVTPSFFESFCYIFIDSIGCMDAAGISGGYIPVEIVVSPVMDFFRESRHDSRVVAADLIGTAAGEAGDAAPDSEFIKKEVSEFVEIATVYFFRPVYDIVFMLVTVKGEGVSLG